MIDESLFGIEIIRISFIACKSKLEESQAATRPFYSREEGGGGGKISKEKKMDVQSFFKIITYWWRDNYPSTIMIKEQ